MEHEHEDNNESHERKSAKAADVPVVLELDEREFAPYFEHLGLPPEQLSELLNVLWDITRRFVELGWGVDSIPDLFPEFYEEMRAFEGRGMIEPTMFCR